MKDEDTEITATCDEKMSEVTFYQKNTTIQVKMTFMKANNMTVLEKIDVQYNVSKSSFPNATTTGKIFHSLLLNK